MKGEGCDMNHKIHNVVCGKGRKEENVGQKLAYYKLLIPAGAKTTTFQQDLQTLAAALINVNCSKRK